MNKKNKYESYGMLQFSRRHGGESPLFGTSIRHGDRIVMYLRHGEVGRIDGSDFYMGKEEIVEAEMSFSQFAEAITCMNMNNGVPVTIRRLNGKRMEKCPFIDKRSQFEGEFANKVQKINENVDSLADKVATLLSEKKSLTKSDKDEIISALQKLKSDVGTSIVCTYERFNEQMDKSIADAKGEIELFFQNKVNSFANMGLVEQGTPNPISLLEAVNDNETN